MPDMTVPDMPTFDVAKEYWAAKPADEAAGEVYDRIDDYYRYIEDTGLLRIWKKTHDYFYRAYEHLGEIMRSGDIDEYSMLYLSHFRNLLLHIINMATSQLPYWEAQGINTDSQTQKQVYLAQGILEYYLKAKRLDRMLQEAATSSLLFAEGFIGVDWDANAGEIQAIDEDGTQVPAGDLKYSSYTPLDVIRDVTRERSYDDDWIIVRNYRNKFELATVYPHLGERILQLSREENDERRSRISYYSGYETDEIPEYTFYHRKTKALPDGRQLVVLDHDLVLLDGPLPFSEIPVYRMSGGDKIESTFGYTVAFDLLPGQDAIDTLHSVIMTNQSTFGVQNIVTRRGAGIKVTNLSKGLNALEVDGDADLRPLQLNSTPPEIFTYLNQLLQEMETISGINSVIRGQPQENLKSGTAIALVQASGVQFNQEFQKAYFRLAEDLGTATIQILKDYATSEMTATIIGRSKQPLLTSFTGTDLSNVKRVTVGMGNSLLRTTAGKVNVAESLLSAGFIENPQQYLEVLSTGDFTPMIENQQNELLHIREENEMLAQGELPAVLVTDRHDLHILEHRIVGANKEARRDPNIMAALSKHLQEHLDAVRDIDPLLVVLLKMNVPILGAAGPPEAEAGSNTNQGSPGQAPSELPETSPALRAENPTLGKARDVQPPRLPKLPAGTNPELASIVNQGGRSSQGPL